MNKGGQQHQLLAVIPKLQGAATKIINETRKVFSDKHGLFTGFQKTYVPNDDEGDKIPEEGNLEVSTTVGEKLQHFQHVVGPYIDGIFQIEATNQEAKADIEVGNLKLENIPATFLIQFDKRLNEIRGVLDAIPTLDPKRKWSASKEGHGIHEGDPDTSYRSMKKHQAFERSPATEFHPAQADVILIEERIGTYKSSHWSGMITPQEKYEILERLDALQHATKIALSQANNTKHRTEKVADQIFSYLFGDLPLSRGEQDSA